MFWRDELDGIIEWNRWDWAKFFLFLCFLVVGIIYLLKSRYEDADRGKGVSGGKRCAADEKDVSCEQNPFAVGVKQVKVGVHGGQEHEEGQPQCADEDCKQGEKGKSANAFGVGIRRVKVGVHQ